MTGTERAALTRALLLHHSNAESLTRMEAQLGNMPGCVSARIAVRMEKERQQGEAERCKRALGLWRAPLQDVVTVARQVVDTIDA